MKRTTYLVVDSGSVLLKSRDVHAAFGFLQGLASKTATLVPIRLKRRRIAVGRAMNRGGVRQARESDLLGAAEGPSHRPTTCHPRRRPVILWEQ